MTDEQFDKLAEPFMGKNENGVPYFRGYYEHLRQYARTIERAVLAEQAEPVAFVPRCIKDCQYGVVGEFRWNELDENPFDVSNPEEWECAKLYTNPPTAPAEPKPPSTPKE